MNAVVPQTDPALPTWRFPQSAGRGGEVTWTAIQLQASMWLREERVQKLGGPKTCAYDILGGEVGKFPEGCL